MNEIIYVVTSGSYSDYHIVGVFDNKKLAEKVKDWFEEGGIKEFPLNPQKDELNHGLVPFKIEMEKDGTLKSILVANDPNLIFGDRDGFDNCLTLEWEKIRLWGEVLEIQCWAQDKKHAIKIANEKRAQLIALNQKKEDESQ